MLHRFFDAIRNMGSASEFETYCMSLQGSGLSGVPTVDEAREDYRAILQSTV